MTGAHHLDPPWSWRRRTADWRFRFKWWRYNQFGHQAAPEPRQACYGPLDRRNLLPLPLAMAAPVDPDRETVLAADRQQGLEAHRTAVANGWKFDINDPRAVLSQMFKIVIELGEAALAMRAGHLVGWMRPATAAETERLGCREIREEGLCEELGDFEIRFRHLLGEFVHAGAFTFEQYTDAKLEKMKQNRDFTRHVGKRF